MFTAENTEGAYTAAELVVLNAALAIRTERGEDEKAAHDAINNAWVQDAEVSDLV